jgi:multimeric flavodoxin WrbA
MKVLALIGSARKKETFSACCQVARHIQERDPSVQWENVLLSERRIAQCDGCWSCFERGEHTCPYYEDIKDIWAAMKEADGIVLASPVYAMQVSAWMKVFVDRSASLFHRPSFHKPAVVIAATAGGGLDPTIKYLRFAARGWGMRCVGDVGIKMRKRDADPAYRELLNRRISVLADKFLGAMKDHGATKPSFSDLLQFSYMKRVAPFIKYDLEHWREKGWLERGWYTDVRPSKTKAAIADWIVGMLFNYI